MQLPSRSLSEGDSINSILLLDSAAGHIEERYAPYIAEELEDGTVIMKSSVPFRIILVANYDETKNTIMKERKWATHHYLFFYLIFLHVPFQIGQLLNRDCDVPPTRICLTPFPRSKSHLYCTVSTSSRWC
jgi:hypothetical protein